MALVGRMLVRVKHRHTARGCERNVSLKTVSRSLQVENIGFKNFPVNVSLIFPTKLEHDFEMTNYQVQVQEVTTFI